MDHAIVMCVLKGVEYFGRNADGAILGDPPFIENLAQQPPLAPLHDHVNAGALFPSEYPHDARMGKLFADSAFTLKAIEEDGVSLQIRMRNLERHGAVVARVCRAVDGCHAAARDGGLDAI